MERGRDAHESDMAKTEGGSELPGSTPGGVTHDGSDCGASVGDARDREERPRDYDLLEVEIHVSCICVGSERWIRRSLAQSLDRLPTLEAPEVKIKIKEVY